MKSPTTNRCPDVILSTLLRFPTLLIFSGDALDDFFACFCRQQLLAVVDGPRCVLERNVATLGTRRSLGRGKKEKGGEKKGNTRKREESKTTTQPST
jgi:hypothetical protein